MTGSQDKSMALREDIAGNRFIDLKFLNAQTMGDPALEKEILILFEKTSKQCVLKIHSVSNMDELRLHLHSLRGAAAGVGAREVVEVVLKAEQALREKSSVEPAMLAAIGVAVNETNEFIAQILSL